MRPKWQKTRFCDSAVVWAQIATQPPRISPWTLYRLKADFVGYIVAADSMRLSSFKFSWRAPKDARLTSRSAYWPFKVIRCRWFSYHLKGLCDFLLVIYSNLSSISHRFWDRRLIDWKSPIFPTPPLFNRKLENISFALDHWNFACGERRHWAN